MAQLFDELLMTIETLLCVYSCEENGEFEDKSNL